MYVNTELELPSARDTILAFFERIQKQFPSLGHFYRRDNNDYCLEGNRQSGNYGWVALEAERIGSGVVNPPQFKSVYAQHKLVLELIPYMLSVSHLDIGSLDVTLAMDFDYSGNHDEIISEALFGASAFSSLMELPSAKAMGFSPEVIIALSEDCRTQARISVESKTSVLGSRRKDRGEDTAISLSFTIRQYPSGAGKFDSTDSFEKQCALAEELMAERIVPNFVLPLTNVIAQKRLS
jgi:hypothetical protein